MQHQKGKKGKQNKVGQSCQDSPQEFTFFFYFADNQSTDKISDKIKEKNAGMYNSIAEMEFVGKQCKQQQHSDGKDDNGKSCF